jgi:hypothetical protein
MGAYKRLMLLLFGLLIIPSLFAQKVQKDILQKKYSPTELKEDINVLSKVLLSMHPVIGIYHSREYYQHLFDSLSSGIHDSLNEKDFRIRLKLAIDELHCGHTEVMYSQAYYRAARKLIYNYSPYVFLPAQDKVYMLASLNKKKDTIIQTGCEILRINGVSTDSMLRYSMRFISTDGFNTTGKSHYIKLGFNTYYLGLFGRPDTFVVDFRKDSLIKTAVYPAFQAKSIPSIPLRSKDDSLFKKYPSAKMGYRYLNADKKSAIIRIAAFSRKGYKKGYRKIFKDLRKNNTENLIIDLRNNGGGSLENSYRLLSYLVDTAQPQTLRTAIRSYPYRQYTRGNVLFKLMRFGFKMIAKKTTVNDTDSYTYTIKPIKKNHFDKKVFVFVNGGSFSASVLVGAYLKHNRRALFIGEETAGASEGCNAGITPYYKLPNTKLRVRVPAFRIVHDVSPTVTGRGIIPDYVIQYSIRDILQRKDLELQKFREIVSKERF